PTAAPSISELHPAPSRCVLIASRAEESVTLMVTFHAVSGAGPTPNALSTSPSASGTSAGKSSGIDFPPMSTLPPVASLIADSIGLKEQAVTTGMIVSAATAIATATRVRLRLVTTSPIHPGLNVHPL